MRRRRIPFDLTEARRLYVDERVRISVIAQRMGCSYGKVRDELLAAGVELRARGRPQIKPPRPRRPVLTAPGGTGWPRD